MGSELFRFGSLSVSSYTVLVDVGLLAGWLLVYAEARRRGLDPWRMLDVALAATFVGLLGARLVYVVAHWGYYTDHIARILRLSDGGLSWHGGMAGGLSAVAVWGRIRSTSLRLRLDVLTPGAAVFAVCAWLGCYVAGCAYGIETYPGQGVLWVLSGELPDLYGIHLPRVAVQLLGAGWGSLVLVIVLLATRRRRYEGLLFPLWLGLYCLGSFAVGFLRADESVLVAGWRVDQLVDLALALIGGATLAGRARRPNRVEGANSIGG